MAVVVHVAGADALLGSLGHTVRHDIVVEEASQARELINQRQVVDSELLVEAQPLIWDVNQYLGSLVVHLSDEVFQVLHVHLEVLHHHVMSQSVALVVELPPVKGTSHGLLEVAVHVDTVPRGDQLDMKIGGTYK